jgi:predicted nucleic acid-binding protein
MAALYLDTSAVGRLLLGEPEAPAIIDALGRFDQHVASRLMRLELRRLALRHNRLADADQLLAGVALVPLDEGILAAAETVPPHGLATLDSIHLTTALRLAQANLLEALMTYDTRLADAGQAHGLSVVVP